MRTLYIVENKEIGITKVFSTSEEAAKSIRQLSLVFDKPFTVRESSDIWSVNNCK